MVKELDFLDLDLLQALDMADWDFLEELDIMEDLDIPEAVEVMEGVVAMEGMVATVMEVVMDLEMVMVVLALEGMATVVALAAEAGRLDHPPQEVLMHMKVGANGARAVVLMSLARFSRKRQPKARSTNTPG
jgi:hypothetical protein